MVGAIRPYSGSRIVFNKDVLQFLAVMNMRRCYRIFTDKLPFDIHVHMVLVTVKRLVILLRPTGIKIFLAQFRRIIKLFVWCLSLLDIFVFITTVPLARDFHKRWVNYLTLFRCVARRSKISVEQVKKFLDSSSLRQCLTKSPYGLLVGNLALCLNPQKPSERKPVEHLKLRLRIRQIVHRLKNQDLEHHHIVIGRSTGIALPLLSTELHLSGGLLRSYKKTYANHGEIEYIE